MQYASLHLEDGLYLDRCVTWQRSQAHRRPCVLSIRLTEHLHHQVGEAVDDCRLFRKSIGGIHHPENFDDALDTIERAELGAHVREKEKAGVTCRLLALLHGVLSYDLSDQLQYARGSHNTI